MPKVSVIMTVFKQYVFLSEAIESILNQNFTDYEFIIIVEFEADSQVKKIVEAFAKKECRIRLIYNETRLGLSQSLNRGIIDAKGKYIARMDDDDISMRSRFEKQVKLLESRDNIDLCGTLQLTMRPDGESVLYVAIKSQELKAELLFGCQLSHTSVMFRRDKFVKNGWLYESGKVAEDFSLWLSILGQINFENINEVLVIHRYGFHSISMMKEEKLDYENIVNIKKYIYKYLRIETDKWSNDLFFPWRYNHIEFGENKDWIKLLYEGIDLLLDLDKANIKEKFIQREAFRLVMKKRLLWLFNQVGLQELSCACSKVSISNQENLCDIFSNMINQIWDTEEKDIFDAMGKYLQLPKKSKVVIWGLGGAYHKIFSKYPFDILKSKYQVVGICDNNKEKQNQLSEWISVEKLVKMKFDYILVTSGDNYEEIRNQLMSKYNISKETIKILCWTYISLDCKDVERSV